MCVDLRVCLGIHAPTTWGFSATDNATALDEILKVNHHVLMSWTCSSGDELSTASPRLDLILTLKSLVLSHIDIYI